MGRTSNTDFVNLENDIKSLSDENEKLKNENDSLQQEYDMIKIQLNMHMTGGFHQNSTMVGNFGVDHFANMTFASSSPPDYSQAVTECLTTSGDKESNNQMVPLYLQYYLRYRLQLIYCNLTVTNTLIK